jgi:8-oxo-dGTP pyrophosphatase MutT (NUDIX family)
MLTNKPAPITTIDSRIAWECPWYAVRQDRIQLPDNSEGVYNVIEMAGSVWVVPITPAREVVLIHNYRYTLGEWCWELPAGGIEEGQTPLEAAQQELREEAGGTATDWQFLLRASTLNGIGDHYGHFFLATGVTLAQPQHERAEVMTVHTFPLEVALQMARAGEINDAVSVMALLLAAPLVEET